MKKILIIMAIILCALGIIGGIICLSKKDLDKNSNENQNENSYENQTNNTTAEILTKEQISEIEKQYLNSSNVFSINKDVPYLTTDSGIVFCGNMLSGTFKSNTIVEYIDCYGNVKKAPIFGTFEALKESYDSISVENKDVAFRLYRVEEENIKYSSILFKNEEYNGIEVNIDDNYENNIEKIKNYIDNNDKIDIQINNQNVLAQVAASEVISYDYNDKKELNITFILDNDEKYDVDSIVKIPNFNSEGKILKLLS